MRILTYNILEGGVGRADAIGEVIEAQRPNVVCLVEADDAGVVERIAGRLEMDFIAGRGEKHAVALLSRWLIVQSINHAAIHGRPRCLLETLVREPGGREWPVGVVHLKGGAFEADELYRQGEVELLLKLFEGHRREGRPHILAGDFNANSPVQRIDPARCTPRTAEAFAANGGQIPRRVIQMILDAGYVDALAACVGAAAGEMGTFTTQHPGQRLDYVFTYGVGSKCLAEARVEQGVVARGASDHFPVGVGCGG